MNVEHRPALAAPALPQLRLGKHSLGIDSITTHGAARAVVSIREQGSAGGAIGTTTLTREALVSFAIGVLDLAEHLIEDAAYHTSDSVRDGQASVSARHQDAVRRYYRIRDRLPILQLAQRVMEKADDTTANGLLMLLGHCEATGRLPLQVKLDVSAVAAVSKLGQSSQS